MSMHVYTFNTLINICKRYSNISFIEHTQLIRFNDAYYTWIVFNVNKAVISPFITVGTSFEHSAFETLSKLLADLHQAGIFPYKYTIQRDETDSLIYLYKGNKRLRSDKYHHFSVKYKDVDDVYFAEPQPVLLSFNDMLGVL